MFCSKCGQKLNDGDVFCFKCGNRVANAPEATGTSGTTEATGTSIASIAPVAPSDEPVSSETPSVEPVTPVVEQVSPSASIDVPPPAAESAVTAPTVKSENPAHAVAHRSALRSGLKLPPKRSDLKLPPKNPAHLGADTPPSSPEKSPDGKSRLAYQVLALSMGFLGVHNFYARRIALACIQILLTTAAFALCLVQGMPLLYGLLPVVVWCLIEIFAVHEDGKENPWGEDFASAPGIDSIDPMVLAKFRCNKRRSVFALFVVFIAGPIVGTVSASDMEAGAIFLMALWGVVFVCLLVMPWYFHARSKGYARGYSIVLALLGLFGMITFIAGAGLIVKNPFSILAGGSVFLVGMLFPIAGFKVARILLLKNGFKALPPAKKALTVAAIIGGFALAIAAAVCADIAMEVNDAVEQVEQYNRGVALVKSGEFEDAAKAFRIAAEKGMSEAQAQLGWCYANGKGVEKDMVEAVKWFRKAAEQGDSKAQFCLGCCYFNGEGVEKDMDESVRWIRKAAEQGLAEAQGALGSWYLSGEGGKKDLAEAVKWFRKAAEQGLADAQHNLGSCYAAGNGVEKDMVEAVKWFRKAAKQGHSKAKFALKILGESED